MYVLRTKGISLPKINKGFLDDTTTMTNSFVYEKKSNKYIPVPVFN